MLYLNKIPESNCNALFAMQFLYTNIFRHDIVQRYRSFKKSWH